MKSSAVSDLILVSKYIRELTNGLLNYLACEATARTFSGGCTSCSTIWQLSTWGAALHLWKAVRHQLSSTITLLGMSTVPRKSHLNSEFGSLLIWTWKRKSLWKMFQRLNISSHLAQCPNSYPVPPAANCASAVARASCAVTFCPFPGEGKPRTA